MSQSHPGITNIAVADSDLPHLDRLVGVALTSGYRPGGKRPSRATIVGDLIRRAAGVLPAQQAQSVPQEAPGAAQNAAPASAAPQPQNAPQKAPQRAQRSARTLRVAAPAPALPDVPALPPGSHYGTKEKL